MLIKKFKVMYVSYTVILWANAALDWTAYLLTSPLIVLGANLAF